VKQSDLGEYEENVREKQNIQYTHQNTNFPSNQGKSRAPPQTKLYGWQTPISLANQQIVKNQGVW
jgi:hypothetical protein